MPLHISLADGELFVVNGAVLRAVGRLRLDVENQVTILRARDVMKPEEANTPARRLYYACMLAYIDEPHRQQHQENLLPLLTDLIEAFQTPEITHVCAEFARLVATQDFYRALIECRKIIAYESQALIRLDHPDA